MRLLVKGAIAALLVLLIVQIITGRSRRSGAVTFAPASLQPGDALPAIELIKIGDTAALPVLLTEVVGSHCYVLVVFESSCGACEQDAPRWSGYDSVEVGGEAVPVVWLGLSQDTGAAVFLDDFRLAEAYAAKSIHELGKLGVSGTPSVLLVYGSRLVGLLPRLPEDIANGNLSCSVMRNEPF